jgi:hypothetical protein
MKKSSLIKISILSIVILSVFIACFTGLEPATNGQPNEKTTETSLTIAFPSLPAVGYQPRAVIQGGGYLYIQIGSGTDAKLYGPYEVDNTNMITITDLPAGNHSFFAVLYASAPLPSLGPVTAAETGLTETAYRSAVSGLFAADTAASCKVLSNVVIALNRINELNCTLIPFTSELLDCGYTASGTTLDLSGDGHRFVMLSNFDSIPTETRRASTKINLTNTSTNAISIQNVAVYNADGTLAASTPAGNPGTIAAGATVTCLDFPNHVGSAFTLYLRYAGTGLRVTTNQTRTTDFVYVTADGNAVRTINGTSWASTPTGLASCSDLAYGATGFVACGLTSGGYVATATSADGYAWTVKVVDNVHTSLLAGYLGVRPSDGALVMTYLSGATGYASTSLDGWATMNGTGISGTDSSNAYMNGGWYASTSNGIGWAKTTDGLTWATPTIGSCSMYQISLRAYVGGVFFVGGSYNGSGATRSVYRSTDYGASFTGPITLPCSTMSYPYEIVQTASGRLVEFGSGTDADRVCYSDNLGITWTSVTTPSAAVTFNCASATPWGIYAGTVSGLVYASSDNGTSFSAVSVPTSASIVAMTAASW